MRQNPRGRQIPPNLGRRRFLKMAGVTLGASVGVAGTADVGAAQTVVWDELYDNGGNEDVAVDAVIGTADGGYAVLGGTYDKSVQPLNTNLWLVKIDDEGNEEWTREYDNNQNYDSAAALVETRQPDGYAIVATTSVPNTDSSSIWFGRTDSNGNLGPTQTYNYSNTSTDLATDMVAHSSGQGSSRSTEGFAIFGTTRVATLPGGSNFYLLKTELDGSLVWDVTYSYANDSYDVAGDGALVETADGGYALFGDTNSTTGSGSNYYLQKTDADGASQWSQSYDRRTNTEDIAADLVETRSEGQTTGYVVVGTSRDTSSGSRVYWVLRLDDQGGVQRNRTFQCAASNWASAIAEAPDDDGYAILGTSQTADLSESDYCVIRTNDNLQRQWDQEYDYNANDWASSIVQTDDGYALAGSTVNDDGNENIWVVRISDPG